MDDSKKPGMPPEEPKVYSRRQFLQGTALSAAGAVVVTAGVAAILWPDEAPAPAPPPTTPTTPTTSPPKAEPCPPCESVKLPSHVTPIRDTGFIHVDVNKCVGCRLCEMECALFHEGVPDLTKARIKVHYYNPPVDVPNVCQQCGDAPCMAACPPKVAAISKDEKTGAIIIDEAACTGCGLCVDACRTGCIRIDEESMVAIGVCDLCSGNPQCINICPSGALTKCNPGIPGWMFADRPEKIAQQVAAGLYNR